jgi:thioredoxin reductase (NADPH)
MTKEDMLDFAIVGAGPVGIEMSVELKRAGYRFRHFEAGSIGSTIEWWAPETVFFSSSDRISISGVPLQNSSQTKATREEYLSYLRAVVQQFDLVIETFTRVLKIDKSDQGYSLTIAKSYHGAGGPAETGEGKHIDESSIHTAHAKQIVLAIGDMHYPNMLEVPGEDLPHVHHHFLEPHQFSGSKVLIVGGKNSAVEAAIRLARVGAKVTLCQRKPEFDPKRVKPWLLPEIKSLIRNKKINYYPEHILETIECTHAVLSGTDSSGLSIRNEAQIKIPADFVLLLTGYKQNPGLYQSAGVTLEGQNLRPVYNPDTMESNQKGIYLAGTGVAGTQVGKVTEFIETSHLHVKKIMAHLEGRPVPDDEELREISQRET